MNKKRFLILIIILLIVVTLGVSYAFFTYQKLGTKMVTMTLGNVKLHYKEKEKSINILNGLPVSDDMGKNQTDYFEFTITGESAEYEIPYIVASRIQTLEGNKIPEEYISVYLTEVNNNIETEVLFTTYDNLTLVTKNNHVEQKLLESSIPVNTSNFEKVYRLRIWINEDADYTPRMINGEEVYPMQDKSFEFTINVYTEVSKKEKPVVTDTSICELYRENITTGTVTQFEVNSVEDLVCLSKLSRSKSLLNTVLVVTRDIDILDDYSYIDENELAIEDINGNGVIESIKTELTTGKGFYPISNFNGTLTSDGKTISNITISRSDMDYVGIFKTSYSTTTISNLNFENITVNGKQYVGGLVGDCQATIENVNLNNINVTASGYYSGGLCGRIQGASRINNIELDNLTLTGTTYVGGLSGYGNGTFSLRNIHIGTENITSSNGYAGGLLGYTYDSGTAVWVNIDNLTLTSNGEYTGGIAGYSNKFTITAVNLKNVDITGKNYTAGFAGNGYVMVINEGSVRGNITGDYYVGGVFGQSGYYWANGEAHSVYIKANLSGTEYLGGFSGYPSTFGEYNTQLLGVYDGGTITNRNNGRAGKATGSSGYNRGLKYVSSSVVVNRGSTSNVDDGTTYSANYNGDLSYFSNISFEGRRLLESPYSGDVNGNGYWFNYDSDGEIYVMKVSDYIEPIEEIPTGGDDSRIIKSETVIVDNCEAGDYEPPTCVFNGMSPLSNGIMASFSCTDNSGAPAVYSMFNSVKQVTYTAQEIIERSGTQKTGTVNGNTRNITSKWTTSYDGNKPEEGKCYYYQYTAVDTCGNSTAYVTNYCQTGFSN